MATATPSISPPPLFPSPHPPPQPHPPFSAIATPFRSSGWVEALRTSPSPLGMKLSRWFFGFSGIRTQNSLRAIFSRHFFTFLPSFSFSFFLFSSFLFLFSLSCFLLSCLALLLIPNLDHVLLLFFFFLFLYCVLSFYLHPLYFLSSLSSSFIFS